MLTRFYAGAIAFLDGTVSGARYRDEVLTPYMLPLVHPTLSSRPPTYIFMHDGAPIHRAQVVTEFLQQHNIRVMDWPPHSPDLNPVEHLWACLARQVRQIGPTTKTELREAILQAWYAPQTLAVVKKLYASLPRRMTALKRSKEAHIR